MIAHLKGRIDLHGTTFIRIKMPQNPDNGGRRDNLLHSAICSKVILN